MSYTRNYRQEYDRYQGTPQQRKKNDMRKQARRKMVKKHGKAALVGRDIDHVDRNPLNNSYNNLRISDRTRNRSRNG